MKKTAEYTNLDDTKRVVEYDSNTPCLMCGLPVEEASVGGTAICPWCDMGKHRDGKDWTLKETLEMLGKRKNSP